MMSPEEIPIFVALALSLLGMASPTWYKLCISMFAIYLVTIILTQFYFKPPLVSLEYLQYCGALISGLSGIYLGYFSKIHPENITIKQHLFISIACASLLLMFALEAIVSGICGYIYNHVSETHNLLYQYRPFMISSTILQSIILLIGGIDGGKRIISMVTDWLISGSNTVRDGSYDKTSNNELQKRGHE